MKKRNTTKEYFDFLGFAIGAIAELEEDCDDIIRGTYPEIIEKMGLKREKRDEGALLISPSNPHPQFLSITPSSNWTLLEVEKLKFYPLDSSLPLIIQLKLRCKELNFLLKKLQDSLEEKMKDENTLSLKDKSHIIKNNKLELENMEEKIMEENGLVKLENGKFIPKEVYNRMKGSN